MPEERNAYIDGYIARARAAQEIFESASQRETDAAVLAIAKVIFDHAEELAALAVEDTGYGNIPDKTAKNMSKARVIWHDLKTKPSRGIIERDEATGITKVAKPIGVVAAITPVTNPIVTPMSNAMFALKGGNAIILTPHHSAVRSSGAAVKLLREAVTGLGLPADLIQMVDEHSRENTRALISSADIVIATGGMGMVRAAYSSGKPALGVGAGNVQCIIDRGQDIAEVVPKIVQGRGFDYGIICSGEQSVICPDEEYDQVIAAFKNNGAYVVTDAVEKEAFRNAMFTDGHISRDAIGQSASVIAKLAGVEIPAATKIVVIEADGTGEQDILGKEKMCPVIAAYRYKDLDDAIEIARRNLESEGKGHSVAIHSGSKENIEKIGTSLSASRFVVNQVCASSAGGSFKNGLAGTNTLGCGSWGNNSISENLTFKHLINVSRIAYNMEDNVVPPDEELWTL